MKLYCKPASAAAFARAAVFFAAAAASAIGCAIPSSAPAAAPAADSTRPASQNAAPIESASRGIYLAPSGAGYDLITPDGIHVKTNGQYPAEAERKAAAETIDRYWHDVRTCALGVILASDAELRDKLLPEFPLHLSIEVANDWRVVEGPVTHRRQQAFPSL